MKKRRNILAFLLAGCMLFTAVPADALAQEASAEVSTQETEPEKNPGEEQGSASDEQAPEGEVSGKPQEEESGEMPGKPETDQAVQEEKEKEPSGDRADSQKKENEENTPKEEEKEQPDGPVKEEELEAEEEKPIEIDPEDPGKYRLTGRGTGDVASSKLQMQAVSHQAKYSDCIMQHGVDVSYHNGDIDWEKAKATGKVDFAIIRVGYRGYSNGKLAMDVKADENMREANAAGIPIGVYIFSQATSAKEAVQEADFIVSKIKGYKIDLPVVLDFEYVATGVGRLYKAKLSKAAATTVCTSFCDRVKALGYTPMVYANKTMFSDKTYAADFSQKYPIWMANYTKSTSYAGEYEYWQYSDGEKIDGIKGNKVVDGNWRYLNTLRLTGSTTNSVSMKWDAWSGAASYDIYRKNSSGNYVLLKGGVTGTSYTDRSLTAGSAYSYKIYPNAAGQERKCIGFNTGITQLKATSLKGKASAFDKVKLTWTKVAGASSYYIERYNSSKKAYSNIKTASSKSSSYTDGSKNASTKYKYRIRPYKVVFNGRAYGGYSKAVTVKTKGKVKAKTKVKKLALRKSASASSKKLGTVKKKGTKITVVGSSGSWYKVSVKLSGKTRTGYIKKSRIKLLKK